jgi:organic hydroperoxide reductase OsmC/OhrA
MSDVNSGVNNGVNVEALLGAREALTEAPEGAQFKWRATCTWLNGTHASSSIEGFFGLGEEQSHRKEYKFETDHPEIFASEDNGATPVEMVLVGLAGCLTAGIAAVAQHRDIQLRSVKATLDAGMTFRASLESTLTSATVLTVSRCIMILMPMRRRKILKHWWPNHRSDPRCSTLLPTQPTVLSPLTRFWHPATARRRDN